MGARGILAALAVLGACVAPAHSFAACQLARIAQLPVTMRRLMPLVPAKINGVDAKLVADTGAFFNLLTPQSVTKFGLRTRPAPYGMERLGGISGSAHVQVATAKEFDVLGARFPNADFFVAAPQLQSVANGLLGQNVLSAADAEYDLADGVIRLFRPKNCRDTALAYWATDRPYSVVRIGRVTRGAPDVIATAEVNGVKIRVLFDTGAARSILKESAARRAGVKREDAGVVAGGLAGGIGRGLKDTWLAYFDSFRIGEEQIKHTRLRIGNIDLPRADMLIGADFFLSHRIYVAYSQEKLYFTYNGGPVFRLDQGQRPRPASTQASSGAEPAAPGSEPTDAAGFTRRGAAFAARHEFSRAIADFTRAAQLEPDNPKHYYDRAMARMGNRQPAQAASDFDRALKLRPGYGPALLQRGRLRLATGDAAGAAADFDAAARRNSQMHLPIAVYYRSAGQFSEAIAQFSQWIAAHPHAPALAGALNGRCRTRALWGRELDKALDDCNESLKLNPRVSAVLDSRGMVYLRLGQIRRAIKDYDTALRLQPKNAWSLYGRGLAELREGKKARGDADLKASAALAPALPALAKRIGLVPRG